MAWEKRGGKEYFYYGVRTGARVKKLYVGRGLHASLAAEFLSEKESKDVATARIRAMESALHRRTVALFRATSLITEAALACEGFFRHDRGEWRQRRVQRNENA